MNIPPMYISWFQQKCPTHPILKHSPKDLVLQTLTYIKGTKDVGHEWHQLLHLFFTKQMKMKQSTSCAGIYIWEYNKKRSYLALNTDDILLSTIHDTTFEYLCHEFQKLFDITTQHGEILKYLNIRIIQSNYGISMDQTRHIEEISCIHTGDPNMDHLKYNFTVIHTPLI